MVLDVVDCSFSYVGVIVWYCVVVEIFEIGIEKVFLFLVRF